MSRGTRKHYYGTYRVGVVKVCVFLCFYSWTARESFVILLVDRPMFVPHDSKPDHFLLESFLARDRSMLEINHIHCNQSLFRDSIEYIE